MKKCSAPFFIALLQFAFVAVFSLVMAFMFEPVSWSALKAAFLPILYAGIMSGGIAYTIQVVAQRHTPASDAGVIMSAESIFAALAGAIVFAERLTFGGYMGCVLIAIAILMVELGPYLLKQAARFFPFPQK